jgi:minor histocompatibility antigen H13
MIAQVPSRRLALQPDNPQRLANLCGLHNEHLRQLEENLDLRIANRGNEFTLTGDEDALQSGERLLLQLYAQTGHDTNLTPEHIHLALAEVRARPQQEMFSSAEASAEADGPIKLLFPLPSDEARGRTSPYSMLGLGDVAVPGLLASLALRYDASRAVDMRTRAAASAAAIDGVMVAGFDAGASDQDIGNAAADAASAAFDGVASVEAAARDAAVGVGEPPAARPAPTAAALASRPYFTAVVVAYAVGLVAAFGANAVTGAGQPALLYLVPATLGAVAALAALRGDVGKLAAFTDAGPSILGGGG